MTARTSRFLAALLLGAATALAGCKAEEAPSVPPAPVPGLPPVALPDVAVVETNSSDNPVQVLANDLDVSGSGLTVTGVQVVQAVPAMAGTVAGTDGDAVRVTPPADFVGVILLQYSIADGAGGTSASVIAVTVSPVVPPPVALPDVVTVLQDSGPTDIDVLANDLDFAAGGLTLDAVQVTTSLPSALHTLPVVGDKVRFTPAAGFAGIVVMGYTVTDAAGHEGIGVLTVIVSPLALPTGPVPLPDAATVAQDSGATDIDVLANDVDLAGDGLTVSAPTVTVSVPNAAHSLAVVGNQVRFTPAPGFFGSVVVAYTATDGEGGQADGVLTILVSPLALAAGPVPVPDAATVAQDSGATEIDVLANDIDPAGDGLVLGTPTLTASVPTATHTLAVVGNKLRFTPAAGFAGVAVVAYTATDGNGNTGNGVLNVVVSPLALDVGPVPLPDAAAVAQDSGATDIDVLANDVSLLGGALTLGNVSVTAAVPAAAHTLSIAANQVRFTPAAGFAGAVVVSYTATDAAGAQAPGVLSIVVTPLDPAPGFVAIPDTALVAQDAGATDIDVLANDVDVTGGGLTLTGASVLNSLPAASHAVSIVGNELRFTPAAGFAGIVLVSYTAVDANGQVGSGLLDVTVTPAALTLGPLALPDVAVKSSSLGATSIDVLANDVDPAGGGLTLTQASILTQLPGGAGTVSIVGNQVRYTPSALYIGAVVVTYTATDINGNTTVGELAITVTL